MSFDGAHMTPIGGNSRAGVAPMGWGYESAVDTLAIVQGTGYFDSFSQQLLAGQYIYAFLTDGKVFLTVATVDKGLKQVTLDNEVLSPFLSPENVQPVKFKDDFPAPVAGVITLDAATQYELYDSIELGTDRLVLPFDSIIRIVTTFPAVNNLLYSGDAPMISSDDFFVFTVEQGVYIYAGGGTGSVFDVDAGALTGVARFFAFRQVFLGFDSMGTIKNCQLVNLNTIQITNSKSFILENNNQILIEAFVVENLSPDPLTTMQIIGEKDMSVRITNAIWQVGTNQAALFIDPNIGVNSRVSLLQIDVAKTGNGEFFQTGVIKNIIGVLDTTLNKTIIAISDNSPNGILVRTSGNHDLSVFQEVIQSTSTPNYDVPANTTAVPASDEYVLDIAFEGNDTGTFIANTVRMTVPAHGLTEGQTLLVKDTMGYNGGAKIYSIISDTFEINRIFVGNSLGTIDTGSLTGVDPRVRVFQVQGEKDSKTLFNFGISGNVTQTTIAVADTFGDLDFTGATPITVGTERFLLIDPVIGEFLYEGMDDVTLMISGFSAAFKVGSTKTYTFMPAINGIPQVADIIPAVFDIRADLDTAVFSGVLTLSPGDTIKMQIKTGVGNTDFLIIENFSFIGE